MADEKSGLSTSIQCAGDTDSLGLHRSLQGFGDELHQE